jgi:hypothetical protein
MLGVGMIEHDPPPSPPSAVQLTASPLAFLDSVFEGDNVYGELTLYPSNFCASPTAACPAVFADRLHACSPLLLQPNLWCLRTTCICSKSWARPTDASSCGMTLRRFCNPCACNSSWRALFDDGCSGKDGNVYELDYQRMNVPDPFILRPVCERLTDSSSSVLHRFVRSDGQLVPQEMPQTQSLQICAVFVPAVLFVRLHRRSDRYGRSAAARHQSGADSV